MFTNIDYFLVIANCRNLSAAAKELGISQPALSGYLKKLETRLGFALFDRSKNPWVLTDAGKLYLSYVKKNIHLEEDFQRALEDFDQKAQSQITIAGAVSTNILYLPEIMSRFTEEYPDSQIRIVDGKVSEIFDIASDNQIDFFISPDIKHTDIFEFLPISNERIIIGVPENWKINEELKDYRISLEDLLNHSVDYDHIPGIPLKQLEDCTFILLDEETNVRKASDTVFDRYGFAPRRFIQVDQMVTGFYMTLSGSGISFLTDSMVRSVRCRQYPIFYKVDGDHLNRQLYLCFKKDHYLSKAAQRIVELLTATPL